MPKRDDIDKVMIIGSGPIVIGQACEFDYSGTQACKALRSLGYKIVLVNSNPATIMTDPGMADVTYIEPLNLRIMTEIVEQEKPDALLPNLGGQSGLNLSSELARAGVLEKHGVQVIGVQVDAIERGEDRQAFKDTMDRLGIEMPSSKIANSLEEAEEVVKEIGLPCVIRPAYTMGGTGGGLVYNMEEFRTVAARGLSASLVGQILVEESVLGWEELELEVVRDAKNQMITVCFIENVDAMGVHTGDSYCTAPMLTIDEDLQKRLQKHSYDIVEAIQVIGGTNIQFAHDPKTGRVVVIEINPRTSRSSALASKATGFPIAYVSSLLAGGLTMDEIPYWRDGTLEKYTPSGDYVVVKFCPLGLREVRGAGGQAGYPDACGGRGHEPRQDLQGGISEGDSVAGDRTLRAGLCQGFPRAPAGGTDDHAGRTVLRTPVHHVRGPAERRRRADAVRDHLHQALVHRTDEGTGRVGRGDPQASRRHPARRTADPRQKGRVCRPVPGRSCSARPRRRSAISGPLRAWSKAGMRCPSAAWRTPPTTTRPTMLRTRPKFPQIAK